MIRDRFFCRHRSTVIPSSSPISAVRHCCGLSKGGVISHGNKRILRRYSSRGILACLGLSWQKEAGALCFLDTCLITRPDPSFLAYRLPGGHLCHCRAYTEQIALVREAVALLPKPKPKPLPSPINRLLSRTPFSLLTDAPALRRLSAHSC